MATRSRTSSQKRQKELARMEKQREKAAKRMQRKLDRQTAAVRQSAGETPLAEPLPAID